MWMQAPRKLSESKSECNDTAFPFSWHRKGLAHCGKALPITVQCRGAAESWCPKALISLLLISRPNFFIYSLQKVIWLFLTCINITDSYRNWSPACGQVRHVEWKIFCSGQHYEETDNAEDIPRKRGATLQRGRKKQASCPTCLLLII